MIARQPIFSRHFQKPFSKSIAAIILDPYTFQSLSGADLKTYVDGGYLEPVDDYARLLPRKPLVRLSALTGEGMAELLTRVEWVLEMQMVRLDVLIPYESGDLVALIHRRGLVEREEHTARGIRIVARVPASTSSCCPI